MNPTLETFIPLLKKYSDWQEITRETTLRTELLLNSFDFIQLLVDVEDAYSLTAPIEKLSGLSTVGEVLDCLCAAAHPSSGAKAGSL